MSLIVDLGICSPEELDKCDQYYPWDALNDKQQEIDALRCQGAKKDGVIMHLRKRVRMLNRENENLKQENDEKDQSHYNAQQELKSLTESLREQLSLIRDAKRCRDCDGPMFRD
jgi:predicted RNase H-like nuclease (RuvC/YqgF family)